MITQGSEHLIPFEQARTLDGLFWQRVRRSPQRAAYAWFDRTQETWRRLSWQDTAAEVARWREALLTAGLEPGDRVAILLRNCPEWVILDQAALSLGLVTVPLYTDDQAENAAYILKDAAVSLLVIQDATRWKRLAATIEHGHGPQQVVLLDRSPSAKTLAAADERVVIAAHWLPAQGQDWPQRAGEPDALASLVYTSGTTGKPKGVMLTHANILGNAHAALNMLEVHQDDIFLSFLPLSHMLERTAGYYLPMMSGSMVAYARSVGQLGEDLQQIRPTVLIAVPRVFERLHQRLEQRMRDHPLARALLRLAIDIGWRTFEYRQGRRRWSPPLVLSPILKRLIARPVLARLGGRMRVAVSGGAPLSMQVARLFLGLELPLIQGYGLTETSPVISVNPLEDNRPETVGLPLPGVAVRIGPDDELLVKGPGVMRGYWNNPAATAQVLDASGWLRTGDQARLVDRHIQITGRIKDILVLSNGEKIPPADMELAILADPLFDQAMVIGEGRPYLGALLVLNAQHWITLARDFHLDPAQPASLENPQLVQAMLRRLRAILVDFPGYAKIRRVVLCVDSWSLENGLMTPTMKIKRHQVLKQYHAAIERLYDAVPTSN